MALPSLHSLQVAAEDLYDGWRDGRDAARARVQAYARAIRRPAPSSPQESVARDMVARETGFPSWDSLTGHVESLGRTHERFDEAVEAVVEGREADLRTMLGEDPELARARSEADHGSTLLHYVAANGVEADRQAVPPNAAAVAGLLLEAGADPDALQGTYDGGWTSTPLCLLASSAHPHAAGLHPELVRVLVRGGARVDGILGGGEPLVTALSFLYPAVAGELRGLGARRDNVVFAAALGDTDSLAAMVGDDGTVAPGADRYVEAHGRVFAGPAATAMALVKAALCGRDESVAFLLDRGVPLDAAPLFGQTALHQAAYAGQVSTVRLLLERGADATRRDEQHRSPPTEWAFAGGHDDLRRLLQPHAANTVHRAMETDWTEGVRRFLDGDPEQVHARDEFGNTPLHILHDDQLHGKELVELLLERGADVNARSRRGWRPLDHALRWDRHDLAELLREHGARRGGDGSD